LIGLGTIINVAAIVLGAALGVALGHRLQENLSKLMTDAMGLVVLVIGALNLQALANSAFAEAVTSSGTLLVVLGALLIGGTLGWLLKIDYRLEHFGTWLQLKTAGRKQVIDTTTGEIQLTEVKRQKFIEGFINASLLFTIGPMAVLGALQDGLGQGFDILALKSTLDGFTSIAFAATLGWGVAFAAIPVGLWQGLLTVLSAAVGAVMTEAVVASITATGGILLLGTGLRVLQIKMVNVANLLPALLVAPLITLAAAALI
jgi:uncharacterized membrane protein YqgA involved in biofilm formation